ncbi:MAG: non-heme iron oxygenase ferredoxin subunit [Betaproteobacteria bacterium]|nr:non-heme iron oxygenase ferredoxin subunit [Betaproteobacteria bacterium]
MSKFVKVATKSEIADQSAKLLEIGDKRIALFNVGGRFYALDDTCPHADGPLSEGSIEGEEVECPWHGSRFNIKTGEVTAPPAVESVARYNVRVTGDDIEVEV